MTRLVGVAAVSLLLTLTACSAGDGDWSSVERRASAPASASPSPPVRPSPSVTAPPSAPAGPRNPSTPPRTVMPTPEPLMPSASDRQGDLVRGVRTLVGTVEPGEVCLVLRVGADRWALVGAAAQRLASGTVVEVLGTVVSPPPGCHAARALQVSQVRPR